MVKNKKLKDLKKLLIQQKEKYGITESFSYRFDSRTKRLILCYTLPQIIRKNGEVKVKKINKEKYKSHINDENWKRYFKGSTTIVKDDSVWVKKQRLEAERKHDVGMDENDFKWWVESYLSRESVKQKPSKNFHHYY